MHMRNMFIFILLIIVSINISSAGSINGFVYNVEYNDPNYYTQTALKGAVVTAYNNTWSYTTFSLNNGAFSILGTKDGTVYNIDVVKSGYVSNTVTATSGVGGNVIVYLNKETAPNYVMPHFTKFTVQSLFGTKYENVETKLYYNNTLTSTQKTGTDGGVGFELSETRYYTITFINATQGISRTWKGYPTETSYKIIVFPSNIIPDDREQDDILFGLNSKRINVSTGYINVSYTDESLTTTTANLKIYDGNLNGTLFYSSTLTSDSGNWSVLTPADDKNYSIVFEIDNSQLTEPLKIYRTVVFADDNRYDLGFEDNWNYILISVVIIIGIFALFSRVNAEVGAVIGVLCGWFMWMIGWLNSGMDDSAQLTMGLMLVFATLLSVGAYIRKGEDA